MKRKWFQDKDGTYFRNLPLIMAEQRILLRPPLWFWRLRRLNALDAEWDQAWLDGLIRKDHLGRGDVVVRMAPFREVYPNHPGLWILDKRLTDDA